MTDKNKQQDDDQYAPGYSADDIDKLFGDAMNDAAEEDKKQQGETPQFKDIGEGKGGVQMPVD